MQIRSLSALTPATIIQLNPNQNKQRQKDVTFQGIEGKVIKDFRKFDENNFVSLAKGLGIEGPADEIIKHVRRSLMRKKLLNKANDLINLPPETVTIGAGKKQHIVPNLEKAEKVTMVGGRLFDETVQSLAMSGGNAENIKISQNLFVMGGKLNNVEILQGAKLITEIGGTTKASGITSDLLGHNINLSEKASLADSSLSLDRSFLNLAHDSKAERIVGYEANVGGTSLLKGFNKFEKQKSEGIINIYDAGRVEDFKVHKVKSKAEKPGSYIKDGECESLEAAGGSISNIKVNAQGHITGPATLANCQFHTLQASSTKTTNEIIDMTNLNAKAAFIGRNAVLKSSTLEDILYIKDNAIVQDTVSKIIILKDKGQLVGGKTNILEIYGDVKPQGVEVTDKVVTYKKDPTNPDTYIDDEIYDVINAEVKKMFNLK